MESIGHVDETSLTEADGMRSALPEHSMVHLAVSLDLEDGRIVPAGALGAIVFIHGGGRAYEVEFVAPFHAIATVEARNLTPSRSA